MGREPFLALILFSKGKNLISKPSFLVISFPKNQLFTEYEIFLLLQKANDERPQIRMLYSSLSRSRVTSYAHVKSWTRPLSAVEVSASFATSPSSKKLNGDLALTSLGKLFPKTYFNHLIREDWNDLFFRQLCKIVQGILWADNVEKRHIDFECIPHPSTKLNRKHTVHTECW